MSSYHGVTPILEELELTATDFAVWAALCSFAQWHYMKGKPIITKPGTCYPSDKAISIRAHCSESSVKRSVKKLEALGHVTRKTRRGEGGEQRSNDYVLKA